MLATFGISSFVTFPGFFEKQADRYTERIEQLDTKIDSLLTINESLNDAMSDGWYMNNNIPDFAKHASLIKTKHINKSKLKHILIYTYGLCIEYNVPYKTVLSVIQVESSWNPKAKSKAGARGLMQIMPRTAWRVYGTKTRDLTDPYVNVTLGIRYLSDLKKRFNTWEEVLTAYNHGPSRINRYSADYIKTNEYVMKVFSFLENGLKHISS